MKNLHEGEERGEEQEFRETRDGGRVAGGWSESKRNLLTKIDCGRQA